MVSILSPSPSLLILCLSFILSLSTLSPASPLFPAFHLSPASPSIPSLSSILCLSSIPSLPFLFSCFCFNDVTSVTEAIFAVVTTGPYVPLIDPDQLSGIDSVSAMFSFDADYDTVMVSADAQIQILSAIAGVMNINQSRITNAEFSSGTPQSLSHSQSPNL